MLVDRILTVQFVTHHTKDLQIIFSPGFSSDLALFGRAGFLNDPLLRDLDTITLVSKLQVSVFGLMVGTFTILAAWSRP